MRRICNDFIVLLCATCALLPNALLGSIEYQEIKNQNNIPVFQVLNSQYINVPNRHRPNEPLLKLSLVGTKIDQINTKSSTEWTVLLSDKSTLDLSLNEKPQANVTEYYLLWHGGGPNVKRQVCVHYGFNEANWYNSYQSQTQEWPMNVDRNVTKNVFNYLLNSGSEYSRILEHLYVNSDGFAMLLDEYQPWFVSRDSGRDDPILCFSVSNQSPYMSANKSATYFDIKLRLFASTNIRTVADYVVHQSGHIPKPTMAPEESKFLHSIVYVGSTKRDELLQFTAECTQKGFKNLELLLNGYWEKGQEMTIDETLYPNFDVTVNDLAKLGFTVRLELSPIAKHHHQNTEKFFVKDQNGKLTNIVDFTRDDASDWYNSIYLKKLHYDDNVNLFHVYHDDIVNVQMFNETDPNLYLKQYISSVAKVGSVTTQYSFKFQHLPIFLMLLNDNLNFTLSTIIPNALAVSIGGYSFFSANLIGYADSISEEIYIRWVQAASLMPGMSFWRLPLGYSVNTIDLTRKFINLHSEHVSTIVDLARKRLEVGSPIIRPMWYVAPDDPKTYHINDQYMLGNDILVAPVLRAGQRERSVYLPAGEWIDQNGKVFNGTREFLVAAPLEELPYFKRHLL